MRMLQKFNANKDEFSTAIDPEITDDHVRAAMAEVDRRNTVQLNEEIVAVFQTLETKIRRNVENIRDHRRQEARLLKRLSLVNEATDLAKKGNFGPALALLGELSPCAEGAGDIDKKFFND